MTTQIPFDRYAKGIKCPSCGVGYAERVETTPAERFAHGCDTDHRGMHECCARAFQCLSCGIRVIGTAEAPEME
jgi:hypothetical protein